MEIEEPKETIPRAITEPPMNKFSNTPLDSDTGDCPAISRNFPTSPKPLAAHPVWLARNTFPETCNKGTIKRRTRGKTVDAQQGSILRFLTKRNKAEESWISAEDSIPSHFSTKDLIIFDAMDQ